MKKLTILIDMDDTLEDLLGAWVSYLNTQYGTNVHKEDTGSGYLCGISVLVEDPSL